MTSNSGEPNNLPGLDALARVVREGTEPRTPAELDHGLDSLFARIAAGRVHRRRFARWSLLGATTLLCALAGWQAVTTYRMRSSAPALSTVPYHVEGGSVLEGGYLRGSGDKAIKVLFNEGSTVVLASGTRGRLRAVDSQGARVAIEQGTAAFRVAPSNDRRWLIEVGPFLVTVKGTVFTVSWDAGSERFELRLGQGRVVVSGPVSGGDIVLRAGQRLVVNLPGAETLIIDEKPEDTLAESAPAPAPPAGPAPAVRPEVARDRPALTRPSGAFAPASSTVGKLDAERRWADELASGHWDRILADVERTGLAAALDKATSEDLFALANAARYRRRTDLARAALLAERRRFPASPRALDAIFLLGRVEESGERSTARALAYYEEYLAIVPSGAYAAEALGRKMTLTSELAGPAEARPIAEEYLRRFPKGSYAGSARALRSVP
jgi:TolA-binding protein